MALNARVQAMTKVLTKHSTQMSFYRNQQYREGCVTFSWNCSLYYSSIKVLPSSCIKDIYSNSQLKGF